MEEPSSLMKLSNKYKKKSASKLDMVFLFQKLKEIK
jgi:hypothetical protein